MSFIPQPCQSVVGCSGPAAVTSVPASITTVTIIAANSDRCSLIIYNDSTSALRIKFGPGASSTDYTLQIPGQGSYIMEPPALYTGLISGVWEAANGAALVTEIT